MPHTINFRAGRPAVAMHGRAGEASSPVDGLRALLNNFPRERVYVVPSEQLWRGPVEGMHAIVRWLGLRPMSDAFWRDATSLQYIPFENPATLEFETKILRVNQSRKRKLGADDYPEELHLIIRDLFRAPNCQIRELLGVDGVTWAT